MKNLIIIALLLFSFSGFSQAPDEIAQYQGKDFLITRDLVSIKDSTIFFKSRDSDLIKVGGISVYPKDIETVIKKIHESEDL